MGRPGRLLHMLLACFSLNSHKKGEDQPTDDSASTCEETKVPMISLPHPEKHGLPKDE